MKLPEPTEIIDMAGDSHLVYTEAQYLQGQRDALEAAANITEHCPSYLTRFEKAQAIRNMAKEIV